MGPQGTKIGAAYIEISANDEAFRRRMQELERVGRQSSEKVATALRKVDAETNRLTGSMKGLKTVMLSIGGAAAIGQLVRVVDAFTQIRNKLQLVVKEGENLADVEERLFQLALKNRAAIEPTVALYSRLRAARSDLSDEQALKIVDTWNKTLVISGASAAGAAASTIQLSQAMAGGVLRAEEFNSIVENNVRAVQLLASSMGVTMGELRTLVNDGKVGFDQLVKAMTTDAKSVGDEFGKMSMTVGQAMTNLETSMIRFVGLQDQKFQGSRQLAEWIDILAKNFDVLATAVLAAGSSLGTAFAVNMVLGLVAAIRSLTTQLLSAGSAAKALGIAMSWMGGPWGIALSAIAAGISSVAMSFVDLRSEAQKADDRMKAFEQTLQSNAAIIERWEMAQAAQDVKKVGDAAKQSAADVTALNAAMERSEKQMRSDTLTLQARQAQEDVMATQRQLDRARKVAAEPLYGHAGELRPSVEANVAALETRLAAQKKLVDDLLKQADALSRIPTTFMAGTATQTPQAVSDTPPGMPTLQTLSGYYTALETYERELADIREAAADGAVGANRAIIQAMMDYLDAGGSVRRVLKDISELSGDLLDPESIKLINQFVDVVSRAQREMPEVTVAPETAQNDGSNDPWAYYQQRVAEATKWGLMNAIETGDWGDAFGQILTDVTREALSNALDVLWDALSQIDWGGQGKGWAGFLGMLGGSFIGKADGGYVSAGQMLRVGEKGSEWFVPNVDGFILPHGFKAGALEAPMAISVPTQLIVNGNADTVTRREIAETLDRFARGLPAVIDARVRDRRKRGAY